MPQRTQVEKLYKISLRSFTKELYIFCQWLERSLLRDKYDALMELRKLLSDWLPKRYEKFCYLHTHTQHTQLIDVN